MLETRARVAVWTEDGRNDAAAEVGLLAGPDGEVRVVIDAPAAPVTFVAVRWDGPWPEEAAARVLGDAWERGYGDLEWRGVVPERVLPWYALVHSPGTGETRGLGVDTVAASFASWRVDARGATLVLDVRCGGAGRAPGWAPAARGNRAGTVVPFGRDAVFVRAAALPRAMLFLRAAPAGAPRLRRQ